MKKTLALLLAVLMVFSSMAFTVAAEDTAVTETPLAIVPLSDCDSTDYWNVSPQHISDMKLELDTETYSQGTGSLTFSFEGIWATAGAVNWMWQNAASPVDVSGMSVLRFDLYLENAAGLANATFDIELRDVNHLAAVDTNNDGKVDTEYEANAQLRLADLVKGEIKDGWNTVEIPFASMRYWENCDKTCVAYFRMFTSDTGKTKMKDADDAETGEIQYSHPDRIVGTEGVTTTIKLDNAYFASEATTETPSGYAALGRGYSFHYYTSGTFESNLKGKVETMDASDYDTVAFDLYVDDLSLGGMRLNLELTSSGTCDVEEASLCVTLSDLAALDGTELTVGWNRIEVPFSCLRNNLQYQLNSSNAVTGGTCDYKNLDFYRIFFNQGTYTVDDDGDGLTGTALDATTDEPEREFPHYLGVAHVRLLTKNTNTKVPFWDATSAPTYGTVTSGTIADFDGDGTNEWVWCNDEGEKTYPANSGAKEIKFNNSTKAVNSSGAAAQDFGAGYPNMVGMEFEVYVSDVAATKGGTFYMEFSHANTSDGVAELSVSGTMNTMFGETLEAGKWQTVRVMFNLPTRDLTKLETYASSTARNVKLGEFNPAGFNYIRFYGGNVTATDLTVAMRNFTILRDFDYEQPTEENCTAPLTMDDATVVTVAHTMRVPTENDPLNKTWQILNKKAGETWAQYGAQSRLTFTAEGQTPLDLSNMDTMHFDLYLENYLSDVVWEFELRDSDGGDASERRFTQKTLAYITGRDDLKDGWNHIEIPLAAFSADTGTVMSNITYMRLFSQSASATVTKDTVVAIDNMCFSGASETSVDTMDWPTTTKIAGAGSAITTIAKGDDANNTAWLVLNSDGTTAPTKNARNARETYVYKATAQSTMSMDIHLTNYAAFKDASFYFEASSGGVYDKEEMGRKGTLEAMFGAYVLNADGSKGTLADGWNHIEIPVSDFESYTACTHSNINYIGIYCGSEIAVDGNAFSLALDNIQFIDHPAKVTKIYSASPVLESSIDFIIKVQDDTAGALAVESVFTGTAGTTKTVTSAALSEDGYYYTTFAGISAHRMTDTLTMKLWTLDENGALTVANTVEDYSVQKYATNMLKANADNTALVTLLSDLLTYGAAAQTYAAYNADNMANAVEGLTPSTFTAPTALTEVVVGTAADDDFDATFKSATLVLDGTVKIRYTFAANTVDGLTVTVADKEYTEFVDLGDGVYYVDVPVEANNFDYTYTAHFGTNTAYAVNYSVNHYIAKMHSTAGTKLGALLEALYNYGASADAYAAAQ